jgi:hypothetical protein
VSSPFKPCVLDFSVSSAAKLLGATPSQPIAPAPTPEVASVTDESSMQRELARFRDEMFAAMARAQEEQRLRCFAVNVWRVDVCV